MMDGPYLVDSHLEDDAYANKNKRDLLKEVNKLRDINAAFSLTMDMMSEAVCLCDIRGNVIFINSAAKAMLGVQERENPLNVNFYDRLLGHYRHDYFRNFIEKPGVARWKGDMILFNSLRRMEVPVTLTSSKYIGGNGDRYVTNIMAERVDIREKAILDSVQDLICDIPCGLGIWHMESTMMTQQIPNFKLIALNRAAVDRLNPVELVLGKTLLETIREPNCYDIAAFFANVMYTGNPAFIEEFTLDGKTKFGVHAFPIRYNNIGIVFELPRRQVPPDVYLQAYELSPFVSAIFKKDVEGIDFTWASGNICARTKRKGSYYPTPGVKLTQICTAFYDPKFLQTLATAPVGEIIKVAVNDWANENYMTGTLYNGHFIVLPGGFIQLLVDRLSPEVVKRQATILEYAMYQKSDEFLKPDELRDTWFFFPKSMAQHDSPIYQSVAPASTAPSNYGYNDIHGLYSRDKQDVDAKKQKSFNAMYEQFAGAQFGQHPQQQSYPYQQSTQPSFYSQQSSRPQPQSPYHGSNYSKGAQQNYTPLDKPASNIPDSSTKGDLSSDAFRRAFYESQLGMGLISTSGNFIAINQALSTALGYTTDEFLNNTFVPLTHPEDVDKSLGLLRQMISGEIHSFQMIKRYIHKHGHVVWALLSTALVRDSNGSPIFFLSQIQPIEPLKAVLNGVEFKREEEVFHQFFNRSHIGNCLITKDGNISSINLAHCEKIGWIAQEVLGKPYLSFFMKEDQDNIRTIMQRIVEGKTNSQQMLVRYEHKNGTIFWCILYLYALTDANGVTTHLATLFQDYATLQKALNMGNLPKPAKTMTWNGYP